MNLCHIPIIDQHAHNVLRPEALERFPFTAAFTEGHADDMLPHVRHTLFFRRSVRDLAELLGCAATEEAVLAERDRLGLAEMTRKYLTSANLETVLLDDGFLPADILPLDWHQQFIQAKRLLRIEYLAENLIPQAETFSDFLGRFRAVLEQPPSDVVAFKSIAAYRTGLAIMAIDYDEAANRFRQLKRQGNDFSPRLADKVLIDFLLRQTLEVAGRRGMPVQLHTGFGDPDLDLRLANPLHLRGVLEERRFRSVPLILLHASYPFPREAGYLASVYPNVFLDMGLAVPMLSVSGMCRVVRQLLELAPVTKLLYSSDAHMIPDLFFLAAKWGRAVLGQVLESAIHDGDLTPTEAEQAATGILRDHACRMYGVG
ncbi:MAG: amidohydrolase family protein [Gemmataceae bacterium]